MKNLPLQLSLSQPKDLSSLSHMLLIFSSFSLLCYPNNSSELPLSWKNSLRNPPAIPGPPLSSCQPQLFPSKYLSFSTPFAPPTLSAENSHLQETLPL